MEQPVTILVVASNPAPLQGLLALLGDRFHVIVHIDAKHGDWPLPEHVIATPNRYPVFWGGFNLMRAVRELLGTAYRTNPQFRRAVLITGDSLPLLPPDALEHALLDDTTEYIDLGPVANDPSLHGIPFEDANRRGAGIAWRFHNRSYLDDALLSPRSRADAATRYGVDQNTADYIRGDAGRITATLLARLPPRPALYEQFFYGASWWALTRRALDLIVDDMHAPAHEAFFQDIFVPDEHFVQTLLGNKRHALASHRIAGTPVFVDHSDPVRAQTGRDSLALDGFRRAAATHLFARKYDPELQPDLAAAIAEQRFFGLLSPPPAAPDAPPPHSPEPSPDARS